MTKGRPGGNPEITKYSFKQKYEWDEPCSALLQIRIPPSMKKALKDGLIPDWQELIRQTIAAELEKSN